MIGCRHEAGFDGIGFLFNFFFPQIIDFYGRVKRTFYI